MPLVAAGKLPPLGLSEMVVELVVSKVMNASRDVGHARRVGGERTGAEHLEELPAGVEPHERPGLVPLRGNKKTAARSEVGGHHVSVGKEQRIDGLLVWVLQGAAREDPEEAARVAVFQHLSTARVRIVQVPTLQVRPQE